MWGDCKTLITCKVVIDIYRLTFLLPCSGEHLRIRTLIILLLAVTFKTILNVLYDHNLGDIIYFS